MMQLLYFIDQGIPIMGYTGEGEYLVLCGFDQYNVTVYNPVTRETYKAGLNDSTEYFRLRGNDFLCAVTGPVIGLTLYKLISVVLLKNLLEMLRFFKL